jgi:plasmid stabilization system protein ParE
MARFTRTAGTSLKGIADWTFGSFGARQAAANEEDLIGVCRAIADGTAVSRDCRRIIAPDLPEALRFARAAQHFIIFIEDKDEVIIIDFLHARPDLPGRLAGLTDPAGNSDSQGRRLSQQLPIPANASRLSNISSVCSPGLVWTHARSDAPVFVPENNRVENWILEPGSRTVSGQVFPYPYSPEEGRRAIQGQRRE